MIRHDFIVSFDGIDTSHQKKYEHQSHRNLAKIIFWYLTKPDFLLFFRETGMQTVPLIKIFQTRPEVF